MEGFEVVLVSDEGKEYRTSSLVLNFSPVLNGVPNPNEKIHLSNLGIDSQSLEKILEYFSHYNYNPPMLLIEYDHHLGLYRRLEPWEIGFINRIGDEELIKMLHCCSRLQIAPVFQLVCLLIAVRFKDIEDNVKLFEDSFEEYNRPEVEIYLKTKYAWGHN